MANISKPRPFTDRDLFYRRQRYKNRVFARIAELFAEEAERNGVTKHDLAAWLKREPAQVSRWLNMPSNLTLETISDILLALGAEEDPTIRRFVDKAPANYMHPLIEKALGLKPSAPAYEEAAPQASPKSEDLFPPTQTLPNSALVPRPPVFEVA